jgi:hypothetical protein
MQARMWEFCLIELLTYYSCPIIDINLHCLDDFKFRIWIIFYMTLSNYIMCNM